MMAKRQRQQHKRHPGTGWGKSSAGLAALVVLVLVLVITSLTFPATKQVIKAAWLGTETPTPDPTTTLTPTPTMTVTPLPTPSPTGSPTFPPPLSPSPRTTGPALLQLTPTPPSTDPAGAPVYSYRIVNVYPHDRTAYTQGLVYENGFLYEGTGRWGQSTLRRVAVETGQAEQLIRLPPQFFGEGIVIYDDKIVQLTWKARLGFVYDKTSFERQQIFAYPTEGWGITHDGQQLIMSDGTATLYFWDPETLAETGRIAVADNGQPVPLLNELEYVRGEIWANVYRTDRIARIDPATGQVVGWIDLSGLLEPEDLTEPVDVLNGIAYDSENERLFVTGKWWPKLFEIELVEVKEVNGE